MSTTTTEPFRPTFSFSPSFSPSPPPSPTSGFSSIFQSPGGPPLILVFIAAGLLLGAFIGVLLMRRMRPPVVRQRGVGPAAFLAGLNSLPLGEKPKLLDIHLSPSPDAAAGSEEDGMGKDKLGAQGAWTHVSPFAATYLSDPSPPPDRPRPRHHSAQSPSAAAPSRNWCSLARLAARLPWADARWRAGAHELSPLGGVGAQPEPRAVQLAVTVLMPSPQHPSYCPPNTGTHDIHAHAHDKHDEDDPMPDCCIGTVVVSYRHDPNDSDLPPPVSASPTVAAAAATS